jgi:hypothetical protein
MKNLLALIFLVSCSSVTKTYKGFDKVTYVGQEENLKALYFEKDINPEKYQVERSIASVNSEKDYDKDIRNKDVYFKNLWGQSKTLANFMGKEHINSCPAFHQTVLTQDVSVQKLYENDSGKAQDPVLYPFIVLENDSSSNAHDYLSSHYDEVLAEVKELCNTGVSENYFVFENTIRYFSKTHQKRKVKNLLNSYLKMPVFANLYLLDALKNPRTILSNNERDILRKLNIKWFESYLYKLRQRREHRISMR